jgi:hypothetical protein
LNRQDAKGAKSRTDFIIKIRLGALGVSAGSLLPIVAHFVDVSTVVLSAGGAPP